MEYTQFQFNELIEFTPDHCWFGSGEDGEGHRGRFLFLPGGEQVLRRDSERNVWEQLNPQQTYLILCKAAAADHRVVLNRRFRYFCLE